VLFVSGWYVVDLHMHRVHCAVSQTVASKTTSRRLYTYFKRDRKLREAPLIWITTSI